MTTLEEIGAKIGAKGEEIRKLKADKVAKDQLMPHVNELLQLKEQVPVLRCMIDVCLKY